MLSNSTWKSLHMSHNIVFGEICHKYIHMMGWKDQTSKEIVTCGNCVSLSSCCEQGAAGMLRAFPVHFVPLQSNSTQFNMHDSHSATENCMKCGISCEIDFGEITVNWDILRKLTWNLCRVYIYTPISYVNCVWQPHVTQCNVHGSHAATENCMKCGICHSFLLQ